MNQRLLTLSVLIVAVVAAIMAAAMGLFGQVIHPTYEESLAREIAARQAAMSAPTAVASMLKQANADAAPGVVVSPEVPVSAWSETIAFTPTLLGDAVVPSVIDGQPCSGTYAGYTATSVISGAQCTLLFPGTRPANNADGTICGFCFYWGAGGNSECCFCPPAPIVVKAPVVPPVVPPAQPGQNTPCLPQTYTHVVNGVITHTTICTAANPCVRVFSSGNGWTCQVKPPLTRPPVNKNSVSPAKGTD